MLPHNPQCRIQEQSEPVPLIIMSCRSIRLAIFFLALPKRFLTHQSGMHIPVHARLSETKGHAEFTAHEPELRK
ncbi:MAG: hypothetical protein ACJAZP_001746 [Psychromonas sp.]|jgi:hypothetical protein